MSAFLLEPRLGTRTCGGQGRNCAGLAGIACDEDDIPKNAATAVPTVAATTVEVRIPPVEDMAAVVERAGERTRTQMSCDGELTGSIK